MPSAAATSGRPRDVPLQNELEEDEDVLEWAECFPWPTRCPSGIVLSDDIDSSVGRMGWQMRLRERSTRG
jgi:hypothetical protein